MYYCRHVAFSDLFKNLKQGNIESIRAFHPENFRFCSLLSERMFVHHTVTIKTLAFVPLFVSVAECLLDTAAAGVPFL